MDGEGGARCVNMGRCSLADQRLLIALAAAAAALCPECGRPLVRIIAAPGAAEPARPRDRAPWLAGGVAALLALALAGWWLAGRGGAPEQAGRAPAAIAAKSGAILRLAGSNTIGGKLGPALATAYLLEERGCVEVRRSVPAPDETRLTCRGVGAELSIDIAAHGSGTAFEGLGAGTADIGMASRAIKAEEAERLRALGDLTQPAAEHVIGRDGLSVIVHPDNRLARLGIDEVAAIFAGAVRDWREVGGAAGPIRLYARDDRSGTFDTFKALVLGDARLAAGAKRFEDSRALSEAVAADVAAIGFIGLPYIGGAKPLALSARGAAAILPNRLSVATEDYPLARRLYLYAPASAARRDVRRFVDFAFSARGQAIVEREGFVSRRLASAPAAPAAVAAVGDYGALTGGALRLSTNFQFPSAGIALDASSTRALGEVADYLAATRTDPARLMLLGFADGRGAREVNCALSERRARAIADELAARGVRAGLARGLCDANPIGDDRTREGQARNRRVEAWVRG